MIKKNIKKNNRGFVILFAVTLSAILLSIALGVANIAFKEIRFSTSGRDTNDAFFAADVGTECTLYYDRSDIDRFIFPNPGGAMTCTTTFTPDFSGNATAWFYNFTVTNLGNSGQGCAKVIIKKTVVLPNRTDIQIISNGYNNGGGSCVKSSSTVERQIETNFCLGSACPL